MTQALLADSNRTFTQVEIVYFSRWWSEQTNSSKVAASSSPPPRPPPLPSLILLGWLGGWQAAVRGLVKNGQLDFSLGGWVMSDEATTLRGQNIDQMTEGMLWLKRELDFMPTAGWHIDPFGHAQVPPPSPSPHGHHVLRLVWHLTTCCRGSNRLAPQATPSMLARMGLSAFGLNRLVCGSPACSVLTSRCAFTG